ncbi:MAG: hypothetical protein ABIR83_06665 [Nakamurella sp.]
MTAPEVARRATELGALDVFVLRHTEAGQWVNLGGVGRGEVWIGPFGVQDADPVGFLAIPAETGELRWFRHRESTRILGPYWAWAAVLVRLDADTLVIVGNRRGQLVGDADDRQLRELAQWAREAFDVPGAGSPARRNDVHPAVQTITASGRSDVWSILSLAADVAAAALRCEVAIVQDGTGRYGATSTWGSVDVCDSEVLGAALETLGALGDGPLCIQDTRSVPLPDHFSWEQGTRSLLVVPLPGPVGGRLVVAHTIRSPRGFTDECRKIAGQLSEAVGVMAYAAMLREAGLEVADSHGLAA